MPRERVKEDKRENEDKMRDKRVEETQSKQDEETINKENQKINSQHIRNLISNEELKNAKASKINNFS